MRASLRGDILFHLVVVLVAVGVGQLSTILTAGSAMRRDMLIGLVVFAVALAAVSLWHSRKARRGRPPVAPERGQG